MRDDVSNDLVHEGLVRAFPEFRVEREDVDSSLVIVDEGRNVEVVYLDDPVILVQLNGDGWAGGSGGRSFIWRDSESVEDLVGEVRRLLG